MPTTTISGAGPHASAAATDRIPASKAGVKGYLTNSQIKDYILGLANTWTGVQTFSNHIIFSADNTYDIGASGATRPRSGYFADQVVAGNFKASVYVGLAGTAVLLKATGAGVMLLHNGNEDDFSRLMFGGTTSSFPALKRSSATLQTKLADDSAFALHEALSFKSQAPSGGTSGTWKLGVAATVSPTSPNRTIEVDIGGTIYYLHAKTTND